MAGFFPDRPPILLTECLQSQTGMGKRYLSFLVLRDFLVPGRRDTLTLTYISHLGTDILWYRETRLHFYILFSLSSLSIGLPPIIPQTCWNWTQKSGYQYVGQSGLCHVIEMASPQRAAVPFFRWWIYRLIILPFSFHFLKVSVGL